jgi:hypothetical protein
MNKETVSTSAMSALMRPLAKGEKEATLNAKARKKSQTLPGGRFPMPDAAHARNALARLNQAKGLSSAEKAKIKARAHKILKRDNPDYKPSKESGLREYIPSTPVGSWERLSAKICDAAQDCTEFGGPVSDDYNDHDAVHAYDISIYASYPTQSCVVIANSKLGKMWSAKYAVKDGAIEFSEVKPTDITLEALRNKSPLRRLVGTIVHKLVGKVFEGGPGSGRRPTGRNPGMRRIAKPRATTGRTRTKMRVPGSNRFGVDSGKGKQRKPTGRTFASWREVTSEAVAEAMRAQGLLPDKRLTEAAGALAPPPGQVALKLYARIRESETSADGKTAKAVCIMISEGPGNPHDRHYYSAEAIEAAVKDGVFEGKHSFADHPSLFEDKNRPERSVRDLLGWWSDVHVETIEGRKAMVGTFNIEYGNEFAINKMREAKTYAEKYPNADGYVGFSINAHGASHPGEIQGQQFNIVDRITEAVSTDMVTRAGARGKLINLKEAMLMKNQVLDKKAAKVVESIATAAAERAAKKVFETIRAEEPERVKKALEAIGINLSKDQSAMLDKHLSHNLPKEDEDESEDDMGGEAPDVEDTADGGGHAPYMQDEDEDEADDTSRPSGKLDRFPDEGDEYAAGSPADPRRERRESEEESEDESKREKRERREAAARREAVRVKDIERENASLKAREARRVAFATADKVMEDLKIAAEARPYLRGELTEIVPGGSHLNEKSMREKAKHFAEALKAAPGRESVVGNVARTRESGAALMKFGPGPAVSAN